MKFNMPIEQVAGWSWKKRYAYAVAIGSVQEESMGDYDMGDEVPYSVPSSGSMPSTGSVPSLSGNHHPSVGRHDNVINIKN